MNVLEVKTLCKTYGGGDTAVDALKEVTFSMLKTAYKRYSQTVIMITHNRSIASTANRVLQISDGVPTF